MDKKIAGLLGAVAAVTTLTGAQAATQPAAGSVQALNAASYADLLTPVPNAVEQLQVDDAARAQTPGEAGVKLAQDHHHHHNRTIIIKKKRDHHHHHHHHHQRAFIGIPGVGGVTVGVGHDDDHRGDRGDRD